MDKVLMDEDTSMFSGSAGVIWALFRYVKLLWQEYQDDEDASLEYFENRLEWALSINISKVSENKCKGGSWYSDGKIGIACCAILHMLSAADVYIDWQMIHDTIKEQIIVFIPWLHENDLIGLINGQSGFLYALLLL